MRKLSTEQEAVKRKAKASYAAYAAAVANKQRAIEEFAERYDADIEPLRLRWLESAVATRDAGIPVTQIARDILGHKGTVAVYQAISEGERLKRVDVQMTAQTDDQRIVAVDDGYLYTPTPDELAPILEKLGLSADSPHTSASFQVKGGRVIAVTPRMTDEGMHPVVALVMAAGSEHAQRLIEFAEKPTISPA